MLKNFSFLFVFTLLSVCVRAAAAPPPNDDCANAAALFDCAAPIVGDNHWATIEPSDTLFCGSDETTIWYTYTASVSGNVSIDFSNLICDGTGGLQMNVLTGACGGPYASVYCETQFTADIVVSFNATAATQYLFIVDGYGGDMCSFDIRVEPTNVLLTSISSYNSCVGASNGIANLTVSGGSTPYSFMWSTAETTEDISGLSSGTYTVTVSDVGACLDQQLSTTISEPNVPSVLTAPISNINSTSADCGGDVYCVGNSSVTQRGVCWNTTGNPTTADNITNDGSGLGVYSSTMTGLTEGTYYVRAYAINSSGIGYGEEKSFSNFATINLPVPVACPTGTGTPVLMSSTTVGALPEPFFDYNGLCYDMFQNNIVIYELNITGNELDVTFSNTTITPMVALLKGDVTTDSLYIVECSSGLNHTYYNINAGETVWVVISGSSPSDNGSFDVSFQNNFACNDCVQEDILVASPSPYYGGYKPGETVNFCYSISNYQDESTSWFHGIAPLFGNGWNTATLVQTFIPPECQSTPTGGLWGWYNSVTGTGTGLTAGPGFFFDADIDGDPGNNFGDNCVDAAANWTFCWSIQARLDTLSGRDLSVEVENYSDGETGSWTDAVCASDANYLINAYMQSPDFLHDTAIVDVLCNGESTGSISLSNFEFGTTAYSFQWSNGATNANITGLAVNTYAVTITDYLSFTTTESYTVTEPSAITATTSTTNSNCSSADGSASATGSGGTGSFSYLWSTSETANTITGLVTGTYTVTATDGNACTAITTSVVSDIGAGIVSVTETDASCNGACDGFVTTTITGGTLPYNYLWSDGQTTDNATGLCAGAYSATITDGIGCVIIQSGTISEPSAITVTSAVTLNESCTIADDGIVNTTVTGGAGAGTYTYIWNTGATTDGLSGLSGGVYTVTVNAGACQQIAAETVTITPDITITSVVQGQSAVFPDGYVNTTVTGGSGAGTYTYIWTTGQIIDDISGLAAGTYCVTVNSGICQQVTCGVVTVAPGISVTTSVIQNESCVGSSDGVISATASGGGGGPYTYFWNTGAVTNSISGLTTGIYIVTVDPGAGQAVSSQSITVSSNLSLSTSVTSNYNGAEISCNGNSDGTASVSVVGGASPYSYLWSNGSFAFTASGLSAGNHNVTVTDGNLCQGSASVLLTEPNILLANPLIDNDETCSGDCDGQATAFPGGGTGGYSYSWLSGGTSPTTSGLCPGSEDITVIDANGCSIVETISITSGAIVTAVINPVPSQCLGNNFNFDGSGSSTSTANTLSFNWDFGDANTATGFGPSNTYSSAGTFSVVLTVTDIGCTDITSSVLEVYSNPVLSGGLMIEPMCSGNSDGAINVTVTSGTTGYNYNWSNGSPSPNIGLLSAGFYSLTVTDANNCITQGNFNLGEPSALSITQTCNPTSGVGASDGGSTVAGSGGSGFYTYLWDNGQTGLLVTGLSAGTINVTTTDSNGCVSIDNCTIVDPTTTCGITLTPSILNPDSCGAGYGSASVNVTGSGTPYNYLWESGNTTTTENNLFGGANYITITDNGGCEEVFTIIIPGAGIDSMVVTSTPAACGVSDGSVLAIVYGGTSPYFYIWLNSNLDSIGTTNAMSNVPAGTYISGVRDVMGCNESGGNFVYNIGGPTLTGVSSTDVTCGNSSDGSVSVSVTGATPPYSYSWQEIDSGNQYSGQTVSGVPQGIYVVTISDSQNPACKMFAPVGVIGPEPIQSIYSPTQESCVGSSDGVIIPYTYGGVSPYTFVWSNGSTADSLVGISAGFYSVTITDVIGCQIVDTGSINILSNLTLLGSATQPNCGLNDGSISLSPSGGISGYSFFWSGGLTGPLQSGLSSGIYSVTVTDGIGCSDTISFTLLGVVPVSFVAYGYSDTCNAGVGAIKIDSVTGGTGTYEYSLDNINFQTTNEFTDLVADTFTVYVIDFGTCVSSTQVIISDTLFDVAVMFTISPDTLCPGDEVTITASGGNQFNWLTEVGTDNTITVFVDSSMYFPIEISLGNCLAIDSAHVIVLSERECWNSFVETPNAFSPDGDGTNDTWIIQGIEFTENTVIIFNRWGDTIGEFENYDNTSVVWNGTNTRGELLPTGTYFYVITIDGEITDKNWIQIVR